MNTYTKTEVEALISNIILTDYYTKNEFGTTLSDYSTISYSQGNYMTSLLITQTLMNNYASITFTIDNFYSKTEIDSTLSDSHYTESGIGTTLSLYSPSAQILSNFYSKLYTENTFISPTETGTLYYNKTETGNMLLSYSTGSYVDYTFYTKTETDTLLADKLINIGNIDLPGWLDIGTSGYTNSRIRCNADVNGYIGYAELRAAGSYDTYLNLSTTRTDCGWMYFKIINDNYMQLPGSDNKVNIYKDTSIGGNSDVGITQAQTSIKTYVNHAGYQGNIQIEPRWGSQGFIHFNANCPEGLLLFAVKDDLYMHVGIEVVYFYKPTANASDDGLKESEELIENACETLSKLRPQLYDKKPGMENDDPTTWYKEGG